MLFSSIISLAIQLTLLKPEEEKKLNLLLKRAHRDLQLTASCVIVTFHLTSIPLLAILHVTWDLDESLTGLDITDGSNHDNSVLFF